MGAWFKGMVVFSAMRRNRVLHGALPANGRAIFFLCLALGAVAVSSSMSVFAQSAGVRVVSAEDYRAWLVSSHASAAQLNADRYNELAMPSLHDEPATFSQVTDGMFDGIVHSHGAAMALASDRVH